MSEKQEQPNRGCLGSCLAGIGGAAGIALLLALAVIGLYFILWAAGGILIIADPLEPSGAVVVLSGGSGERLDEAARIYKEKKAQYVVFTHPERDQADWSDHLMDMKLQAMKLGVPGGGILVTDIHGNSTYQEAKEIRRYLESVHIDSALIVTDPFHTFRTRLIFHEVFGGSSVEVNVRPVRGHWYRSYNWWLSPEGRRMTLEEYAKIFAFAIGLRSE